MILIVLQTLHTTLDKSEVLLQALQLPDYFFPIRPVSSLIFKRLQHEID